MLHNLWLKWALSLGILALLVWTLDAERLRAQFSELFWPAFAVAIGCAWLAIVGAAWRWYYTARQLCLPLSLPQAVSDYFLAGLINQTLPGGVPGDITRAVRHGHRLEAHAQPWGPAFRAVIIERLSGQLMLPPVLILLWIITPTGRMLFSQFWWQVLIGCSALALVLGLLAYKAWLPRMQQDLKRTLYAGAWVHGLSSALVLSGFLAAFIGSARALGIDTPTSVMLPLIPWVLLAMLIPLSVAGWGFREGAAALLWPMAGLPAEQGVAISVSYGLVMLCSSLPGLLPLLYGPLKSMSNKVS